MRKAPWLALALAVLPACNRARPVRAPDARLPPPTLAPAGEVTTLAPGSARSHGAGDFEVEVRDLSAVRTT